MKIALDVSYIQKRRAGIGRYSEGILTSLLNTAAPHDYILHGWSFSLDMNALGKFENGKTRRNFHRVPGPVKRFYWRRVAYPRIEFFTGAIDVFQSMDALLPPTLKAGTVVTVHDLASWKFPALFERNVLRLERDVLRSVRNADAVLAPSLATKTDIIEVMGLPQSRVHVIRPPVSACFGESDTNDSDHRVLRGLQISAPYILYAGTLEPRKNVARLVEAFALLHARCALPHDLILVGKRGWMYEAIFQAIQRSEARTRIRHLDFVPDDILASLYRRAALFVYPSVYEGLGFPILEAMACGVPVVTSDTAGLRETAGGAALLVDPNDLENLAAAMRTLLEDGGQASKLVRLGRERTKQLASEDTGHNLLRIYGSLTS